MGAMSTLFEPYQLRSLTIPNRAWMSPMCQYSAAPEGAEAGRKASTERTWVGGVIPPDARYGWQPVAPSPIPFHKGPAAKGSARPEELTIDGIERVVGQFVEAAGRARAAGFDVVEIHAAHGYLLHQFLSPASNRRNDSYGGSFDNRVRLALEVGTAVRAAWPDDLPVLFRVSATDWLTENADDERDGWTADETVLLAKELASRGVDLIDVSTGGIVPDAKIERGPGYQVPFAERVRAEAGIPVAAVGMITDPAQAEAIVAGGRADAVFIGRELLREPYWARRAATELGDSLPMPDQYHRA
jgi:2,4-dienoyl-CoA reductase-like NADH-dependent reductase (Old Yellow Enzyme family)